MGIISKYQRLNCVFHQKLKKDKTGQKWQLGKRLWIKHPFLWITCGQLSLHFNSLECKFPIRFKKRQSNNITHIKNIKKYNNLAGGLDRHIQKRTLRLSQRFEGLAQFKRKAEVLSKNDHHDANTSFIKANLRVSGEIVRVKERTALRS